MGVRPLKPAVFFDRDGVLNESVVHGKTPHPPRSLGELRISANAGEAVAAVRSQGFLAIVVTNQPDVARGAQRLEIVEALNAAVAGEVGADAVYTCLHDDDDNCNCRKPKPGLILQAAHEQGIDLAASYMIGDRQKDVACGRSAGCRTIFIDRRYAETPAHVHADFVVSSLEEAVRCILRHEKRES